MKNDHPEIFILTHGDIAVALLDAAEKIVGKQYKVHIYSNQKESLPVLSEKIKNTIKNIKTDHIIFFVDLMGGSCWTLANIIRQEYSNIIVITGINLPMLISYFINFQQMPFTDVVQKVISDGTRGICSITK